MAYAVGVCRTRAELRLASTREDEPGVLVKEGFNVYTPTALIKGRVNGQRVLKQQIRGAFPGYLFADFSIIIPAIARASQLGFPFHVLKMGEEWAEVSEEIVNELKISEAAGGFEQTYRVFNERFRLGDKVRVTNGPYTAFEGHVQRCERLHTWLDGEQFTFGAVRFPNSILAHIKQKA